MSLSELKEYCKSLIIYQYRTSTQNQALIEKMVDLIFANNLIDDIKNYTVNIDNAIGVQLDIVGKWVGVDRYYSGSLWSHNYLSFPLYSTIQASSYDTYQGGFSKYSNFAQNNGGFLTYSTLSANAGSVNSLGDDLFRQVIKLKIIKNSINHTLKNIDNAIYNWSGGDVYIIWDFMKAKYKYPASYKKVIEVARDKKVLPVPIGCTIELEMING